MRKRGILTVQDIQTTQAYPSSLFSNYYLKELDDQFVGFLNCASIRL